MHHVTGIIGVNVTMLERESERARARERERGRESERESERERVRKREKISDNKGLSDIIIYHSRVVLLHKK